MRRRLSAGKRMISAGLAVMVLVSQMDLTAFGAGEKGSVVHIYDEGEFLLLAQQCREETFSTGKTFYLENDLDLSGQENLFLPVMDGVFEGNGHLISGVSLSEEMSDYGLFRYVGANGSIRNLTVEAEVISGEEQENIGIIAGSNAGKIENCVSRGTLNGQTSVGGVAGRNEETGKILRSRNEAQIDGTTRTGGIAGNNEGEIEDCSNTGNINTSQKVLKEVDGDGSITISIPNAVAGLTSDERANETGGIAGSSSGSVSYCKNEGIVGYEHLGYETGGIVGKQSGSISYSSNAGTIYGRKDVGGIAGYFEPYEAASYDRDIHQELEDQLDELSDLVDGLGDAGERLGDHVSDNLDVLSDQMKGLRDSLRGYLDDFEDMADDSKDAIGNRMDDVKKTLDEVQFDFDLEKMNEHIRKIEMDAQQMEEVLDQLEPIIEAAGGDMKAELQKVVGQYSGQLQELQKALEELKKYIESQAGKTVSEEPEQKENTPEEPEQKENTSEEPEQKENTPEEPEQKENTPEEPEQKENTPEEPEQKENTPEEPEQKENTPEEPEQKESAPADEKSTDESVPEENAQEGSSERAGETPSDEPQEENGGHMEPMAFTTVKVSDEQAAQIESGMQMLKQLSDDAKLQMDEIAAILSGLPGDAENLCTSVRTLGTNLSDLSDTLNHEIDEWGDELGDMKDELRSRGDGISDSLEATTDALDSDWDAVSDQLDRIKDQFSSIRATISDGLDELKDRIEDRSVYVDISDLATLDAGEGKITGCSNTGEIYSDSEAGGIAGTIAKEDTLDVTDWIFDRDQEDEDEEDEDSKDSITKHVLAAIIDCKNTGDVSLKDDYAGGIVGRAEYGAVIACENYGDVVSEDGSYVGGIAGRSRHGIRESYVLCGLNGASYVGGVAGYGEDISGSYVCAYMDMENYVKSSGAIAGRAKGTVEDNYFVDNGYGAVDGVTRSQEAVSMDYESLIAQKELPENFTKFTIRFIDGDRVVWQDDFSYGEELSEADYPELTEPDGEYVYWEKKDVSPIHRNVTIHAVYRAYMPSVAAGDSEEHPSVLMGGEFYPDSMLAVRKASEEELSKVEESMGNMNMFPRYHVKEIYYYQISQEEPLRPQVILRVEDDSYLADRMMTLDDAFSVVGEVQKIEKVGSFLSVNTEIPQSGYIVVMDHVDTWATVLGALAVIVLTGAILWSIHCRRKQKAAGKEAAESEEKTEKGA